MKKLLMILVPLAMLVAFASVSLATDEATQSKELNQDLNKDISGEVTGGGTAVRDVDVQTGDDTVLGSDDELNQTNSRETRSLAAKRGRQPRRGATASDVSEVQKYWGDHHNGHGGPDEDVDEDEDGGETPY
jgi:hypothetical protein